MKKDRLIRSLIVLLVCMAVCGAAYAADCSYYGDDVPAADIKLNADHLYQDMSIELGISTNQATQLRLFYFANGQQFAVTLPPVSLTPPTQTYKVQNLRITTTFFLVAKRNTSSAVCTLTVPYNIPTDVKNITPQQECPNGYGIGSYRGNETNDCVRVLPPYDTSPPSDFEPNKNPPGGGLLCDNGGYYVIWMRASNPVFGPKCRVDDFNGIDPFSTVALYNGIPRQDFPYAVPGQVRVIVGYSGSPNTYRYISRQLQISADAQGTNNANSAAMAFANPPPAHTQ